MKIFFLFNLFCITIFSTKHVFAQTSLEFCAPYEDVHAEARWTCQIADRLWQQDSPSSSKVLSVSLPITEIDNAPLRKILVLSPKSSGAYEESTRQILSDLSALQQNMQLFIFNYQKDDYDNRLAKRALQIAEQQGIELIVSMGSETTRYLTETRYSKLNVVSVCSKDPVRQELFGGNTGIERMENIAYTSLDIAVDVQVEYIKERFLHALERIIVIYDLANRSAIKTQVEPMQEFLDQDTEIEYQGIGVDLGGDFRNLNESQKRERLNRELFSKMATFTQDDKTDSVFLITGSTELFSLIGDVNRFSGDFPVISVTPSHVREGNQSVFMSLGVSFKNNAKLAADYIEQVLIEGASPIGLPVGVVSTPDISINFLHAPQGTRVPFQFFENAAYIYDRGGHVVRYDGKTVAR